VTDREVRDAYAALASLNIDMFGAVERVHPDDLGMIQRHLGDLTGPWSISDAARVS
jgi:hypothetical protein